MGKIFTFTGPTGTGKTTRLEKWCTGKNNVDGILAPVIDGKRNLKLIRFNEIKILETSENSTGAVKIGRHIFNERIFSWARVYLTESFLLNPGWFIIDEIGPLELANKGLEPAVTKIISEIENVKTNLILVIRESLFEKVVKHYDLKLNQIFNFNPAEH